MHDFSVLFCLIPFPLRGAVDRTSSRIDKIALLAIQLWWKSNMFVICIAELLYGVRPEHVIIYGQSIGTVPSVDLAARYESAAVILHSPLTSGMRVAFPDTKKTYCFDAFPNIDKISKITSPVLIIHGTEDEVIDFSHGLALFERCQRPVEPLWVEGAGHNDVELYGQYLERLKQFVTQELVNL
ncbi:alpha beta hydrolase domain-containing 17B isoform X2 [Pelobates cultripes]|uniref:Alpha beta hydrolase domain-containing 17B isoform X2 n=1 Tax=Pelobates cultripes TaxID=61616 RepID=A0AAD1S9L6_PELCU|nr:alpha beta hydrolase domain-containing 17B isoform X2 [Pelobates cultripes]